MNGYVIREMLPEEYRMLDDFLYEAIYIPEGYMGEVPQSIIYDDPKCYAAIKEFGTLPDDYALVAEVDGKVIGACWAGIRNEYGHIDDKTPSISISLYESYRGNGIGTDLLRATINLLGNSGYKRVSLSVQKENRVAIHVYEKVGFRIVGEGVNETEWLMVCEI